jgi:hypothetical protein
VLRPALAGVVALMVMAAPATGQSTSVPGPWVVDVRGATSGVPKDVAFYPTQTATVVPARGFGLDFGGHIYVLTLGPARVGLGANILVLRATATEQVASPTTDSAQRLILKMRTIAPQISANFGSRDGWSYLSAGVGVASITTRAEGPVDGEQKSGRLRSVNFGGGARWFLTPRVAFGFDVRGHKIAADGDGPTPPVTAVAVSAGLSMR